MGVYIVRPEEHRLAAEAFRGEGQLAAGAYIVRPGKSRHGPLPRWGKQEYARAAIGASLYPNGGVPENVSDLSLCAKVNVWLLAVPDYCGKYEDKKISRQTVARARLRNRAANS